MMIPPAPPAADLIHLRDSLRSGAINAVDLLAEMRERARRWDPRLGSYLSIFDEGALAAAREHERAREAGEVLPALSGVPLGIKALFATVEEPANAQSLVLDPRRRVGADADAVARLRAAGAVITGHNTMVEHAMGRPDPAKPFPIPRNPWDLTRWPGGSSSGTANGLAAGFFAGGLGTDTTGSIRIPAAMCGLTGLKPTHGVVPTGGCLPASPSLDHAGPIVRSARDARLLMEVLAPGFDAATPADPRRIGVPEELLTAERGVSDDTLAAVRRALGLLSERGYHIEPLALPEFDELISLTFCIAVAETYAEHAERLRTQWNDYGRSFRRLIVLGAAIPGPVLAGARDRIALLRRELAERLEGFTAIATPTWPTGAAPYAASSIPADQTNFTAAWSALGFPSLSLPAGFDENGMPVGLLLTGVPGSDATLLGAGEALQEVDDTHLRAPNLEVTAAGDLGPVPDPDRDAEITGATIAPADQAPWLAALGLTLDAHEYAVIEATSRALFAATAPR